MTKKIAQQKYRPLAAILKRTLRKMNESLDRLQQVFALTVWVAIFAVVPVRAQSSDVPTLDPSKLLTQYVHDAWLADDGLPQSTVNSVAQTPDGYLWLGTEEGLARFDGHAFAVFDKTNTASFDRSHAIKTLYVDREGALWIATRGGGLVRRDENGFARFGEREGWPGAPVSAMYEDPSGLWIGTYGSGLYLRGDDATTHYTSDDGLASDFITDLGGDAVGAVWIGTDEGLHRYAEGAIVRIAGGGKQRAQYVAVLHAGASGMVWVGTREGLYRVDSREPQTLVQEGAVQDAALSLHEDRYGTLWVGLDGHGLARLREGRLDRFPAGHALASGRVFTHFEDREGSLWIGTEGHGLHRIRDGKFTLYTEVEALSHDMVLTVTESADGSMWIGTEGGGLNRLKDGRMTTLTSDDGLPSNRIASVYGDQHGDVWIGTLGGGLGRWRAGEITTFTIADGLPSDAIFALYEDADGLLWIGTDAGLVAYDGNRFRNYTQEDGLSSNLITAILKDRRGDVWVGTYDGGLNRLRDGTFTTYDAPADLASRLILTLHEDADGVLWIGTYEGGVSRLDSGAFSTFTTQEGLFSDNIYQILDDGLGKVWMTSNKGVFSVRKEQFSAVAAGEIDAVESLSYGRADGLKNAEFNGGSQPAGWRSRDGRLWFPTVHGVAMVDPGEIRRNGLPPPMVMQQILVDQEEISLMDSADLAAGTRKIEFHFAALSLVAPDRARYRYKLEGYDEEWIDAGSQRAATYTNLSPGAYTFRVVAANNDGVWNEEGVSVGFYLKPFFYQTPAFWLLVALALGLLAVAGHRLRVKQLRDRQRALENVVAERTKDLKAAKDHIEGQAEKLRDLDRFKTQFFANVSHEFRTPLTMILGPLENLLAGAVGSTPADVERQYRIMLRNAHRLMRLINQLLDLSKLEEGKMTLRAQTRNIVSFLDGLVLSCNALADPKGITLTYRPAAEHVEMWFEPDKLEKVFFNLLSNASKFTPAGGSIIVGVAEKAASSSMPHGAVEIRVRDTGKGIPKADLPWIFDRFHQVDGSNTRDHEGTGIGLALVRELVLLHRGTIDVQSEEGEGTEFIITLPVGRTHLQPEEICETFDGEAPGPADGALTDFATAAFDVVDEQDGSEEVAPRRPPDAPTLLIVEDNKDVRDYVAGMLASEYVVERARDGVEGLEIATKVVPDLIISDVMMPKMDGNELCRRIKTSPVLNHIPVLLLTARATHETKIEGLEVGADDYVAKPFNAQELHVRIRNLLRLRRQEGELKVLNEQLGEKVQEQLQILVDERRRYEEDLLSAKEKAEASDRLKSSILNNLSHEFRTPLTAILGYSQILSEETDEAQRELTRGIENGGLRLLKTLDGLLDFSELEAHEVAARSEWTDLGAVATSAMERFRPSAARMGLQTTVEVSSAAPVCAHLDPAALDKIFDHLLDNAVKYTPEGEIRVAVSSSDDRVRFSVQDTGIGIGEAFIPHVFDAFRQESDGLSRSYEGAGLGLTIAKRLVELMDGEIEVESEPDRGTTLTVSFPNTAHLRRAGGSHEARPSETAESANRPKRAG